jgi:hypothetical protein
MSSIDKEGKQISPVSASNNVTAANSEMRHSSTSEVRKESIDFDIDEELKD